MGVLLSVFFGYVPMLLFACFVYWLDRFEKEPKALIRGAFIWGAVIAAGGAFIFNTGIDVGIMALTGSPDLAELSTSSLVAPVIEETLKALAVVIVYLFFHNEFDSILDGIIYAAITALGFAATENAYYIYNLGYLQNGINGILSLAFVRVILVGWQHPFFTSFFGIGLAAARMEKNRGLKILYTVLGFTAAVFTHSLHNTISELLPGSSGFVIGSVVDWSGWIFMFLFVLFMINREKRLIKIELAEEVGLGILNDRQYRTSYSGFNRFSIGLATLGTAQYRDTRQFYQLCGELAHKKNQLAHMGDESGNVSIIANLRGELARLSPVVRG